MYNLDMNTDKFPEFQKWYNDNMSKMQLGDIISNDDYDMGNVLYPNFALESYVEMMARTGLMQLLRACFIAGVAWKIFSMNSQKDIDQHLLDGIDLGELK